MTGRFARHTNPRVNVLGLLVFLIVVACGAYEIAYPCQEYSETEFITNCWGDDGFMHCQTSPKCVRRKRHHAE